MTLAPPPKTTIVPPTKGHVAFTLPYDEAEVLLRAVGLVNSGNLQKVAPELFKVANELVKEFGSSTEREAKTYLAEIHADGQVYVENFWE